MQKADWWVGPDVTKKKSKIDLPTLFFSSLEPETQLFFFFGLIKNKFGSYTQ